MSENFTSHRGYQVCPLYITPPPFSSPPSSSSSSSSSPSSSPSFSSSPTFSIAPINHKSHPTMGQLILSINLAWINLDWKSIVVLHLRWLPLQKFIEFYTLDSLLHIVDTQDICTKHQGLEIECGCCGQRTLGGYAEWFVYH